MKHHQLAGQVQARAIVFACLPKNFPNMHVNAIPYAWGHYVAVVRFEALSRHSSGKVVPATRTSSAATSSLQHIVAHLSAMHQRSPSLSGYW